MALKQERMIAMIEIALAQYNTIQTMVEVTETMMRYIHQISESQEIRDQVNNFMIQIQDLARPDLKTVQTIANERAYFNPTRIKHNEYMRAVQKKHHLKKKTLALNIEEEIEFKTDLPRQNNEQIFDPDPVIVLDTETKNPNPDSELKAKFGENFTPLPKRIGLPR